MVDQEKLQDEAEKILSSASDQQITIRLMGGLAFRLKCPMYLDLFERLKRKPPEDLDFAGLSSQTKKVTSLFEGRGYTVDPTVLRALEYGTKRYLFNCSWTHADLFVDQLRMCHVIDFKERLSFSDSTIPLSDLFLQKMQIVELNEKDVVDMAVLLLEHNVRDDESGINRQYISKCLASDWGFYYTFKQNLNQLLDYVQKSDILTMTQKEEISERAKEILRTVESEPKTFQWKLRSKVGPRQKWYTDVYEVHS